MVTRAKKIWPALKHGAYSTTAVLPGEDPAAFERLHKDLRAEFGPTGALEEDILANMARLIWRKKNLATFRKAELATAHYEHIKAKRIPNGIAGYDPTIPCGVDPDEHAEGVQAAEDQA